MDKAQFSKVFKAHVTLWLENECTNGDFYIDDVGEFELHFAICSSGPDRYEVWSDRELLAWNDSWRDFKDAGEFIVDKLFND